MLSCKEGQVTLNKFMRRWPSKYKLLYLNEPQTKNRFVTWMVREKYLLWPYYDTYNFHSEVWRIVIQKKEK